MRHILRSISVGTLLVALSGCALPFSRVFDPEPPRPVTSAAPAPVPTPTGSRVQPGARVAPTITCPIWFRPNTFVDFRRAKAIVLRNWGEHGQFRYRGLHIAVEMSFDPHEPELVVSSGDATASTGTTYVWTSDNGPGNAYGGTKQGFTGLVGVNGTGNRPRQVQFICRSSG